MSFVDLFKKSVLTAYQSTKGTLNDRYLSWEHCYSVFYRARNSRLTSDDIDILALHLSFYLASWGMYRGSSFLLQRDYKIHIPVIEEILSSKYNVLLGIKCCDFNIEDNQNILLELNSFLKNYYRSVRTSVKSTTSDGDPKSEVTDTLITKILMGTLGCVPAYDVYFNSCIKKYKISIANYNINSILMLCKFYQDNFSEFEPICQSMRFGNIPYPQMKFLDMGFWEIGLQEDKIALEKKNLIKKSF